MHRSNLAGRWSIALVALVVLAAPSVFALKSGEKTPEEQAAENDRKATEQYNEGVKAMDKARAIGVKGDSAYAFNYRATSDAKARKEYEKAVEKFMKAVELKPEFPEAYNNLGYSYRKLGKLTESLAAYDKALDLNKDFAQAREYRGETFLAMGDIDKAQGELDYLRKLSSPYADTLAHSIETYQLQRVQGKH